MTTPREVLASLVETWDSDRMAEHEVAIDKARTLLASTPAEDASVPEEIARMVEEALRIPSKLFPDPGAHSWQAYAEAVHGAFCDVRFKLIDISTALHSQVLASQRMRARKTIKKEI